MWILDAINKLEFKKPFAVLGMTLGAGFLLLAYFFLIDPLHQPVVYSLLALDLLLLYQKCNARSRELLGDRGDIEYFGGCHDEIVLNLGHAVTSLVDDQAIFDDR